MTQDSRSVKQLEGLLAEYVMGWIDMKEARGQWYGNPPGEVGNGWLVPSYFSDPETLGPLLLAAEVKLRQKYKTLDRVNWDLSVDGPDLSEAELALMEPDNNWGGQQSFLIFEGAGGPLQEAVARTLVLAFNL